MLRVAVPNKGSLSESAISMLKEAGYAMRREPKSLVHRDQRNEVEFFYLRPRDIAVYVGEGILDLGITGRDLLGDSVTTAEETLALGFGRSTFHYAAPAGTMTRIEDLRGKRIATSYPNLVDRDLAARGIEARTVKLDGAVEVSVELGVADAIADVVETGSTLRAAGLETFGEPLMRSEGVLIARSGAALSPAAEVLGRRLKNVLVARRYVIMDYDVQRQHLDECLAVTPGMESPTVSDLKDPAWVAVRTMVPADDVNTVMDTVYEKGARAILVTRIGYCRI